MGRDRDLAPSTLISARLQSLYLVLGHRRRVPKWRGYLKKGPKLGVFTLVPNSASIVRNCRPRAPIVNTALVTPFLSWMPWIKETIPHFTLKKKKKSTLFECQVFSTEVLIGDTIFTSPTGDGTAILRGHPSHAKVYPFAGQREYLHFSVSLRPWVLVRPRESNPRPPALQSSALPTELILPRFNLLGCNLNYWTFTLPFINVL